MKARHDIENLLHRYAECIDSGDFEGVARLFAEGAIYGPDGTLAGEGYDAVLALYKSTTRLYENGTPGTRHVTTNLILEFDEGNGTASGRSYFTVFQQVENFPLQAIIAGRYLDRFTCGPQGAWRFARRQMFPEQIGDLSRHLLRPLG